MGLYDVNDDSEALSVDLIDEIDQILGGSWRQTTPGCLRARRELPTESRADREKVADLISKARVIWMFGDAHPDHDQRSNQ